MASTPQTAASLNAPGAFHRRRDRGDHHLRAHLQPVSPPLIALDLDAGGYSETFIGFNAAMHAVGALLIAPFMPKLAAALGARRLLCSQAAAQPSGGGDRVGLRPFHVAVQVRDIAEARRFYGERLGCAEGRSAPDWVDFNMYGHQFVCHLNPQLGPHGRIPALLNPVDGHGVPVPHCGVVLEPAQWQELAARLRQHPIEWVIEPTVRFKGMPGEQSTLFILDPSGNALEFKAFNDLERLFAR